MIWISNWKLRHTIKKLQAKQPIIMKALSRFLKSASRTSRDGRQQVWSLGFSAPLLPPEALEVSEVPEAASDRQCDKDAGRLQAGE